jgi:acetoin utilization deacetylase AcuC-like enzyme
VLVSAGFDAHHADPLSNLELLHGDFAELARVVRTFTPRPGRLALFLEGGYDLEALQSSVEATLAALLDLGGHGAGGNTTSGGPGRRELEAGRAERRRALDGAKDQPAR